jgi:hypothetical protein
MSDPRPPAGPPASTDQILDLLLDALAERQARRGSGGSGIQSQWDTAGLNDATDRGVQSKQEDATIDNAAAALHLGRTLNRLWLVIGVLVVLINVPLNTGGLNLAHLVPSTAALIIRDGLVLKGPGPEIYVLQSDKLRWISSLDAFQYFGYRWDEVHVVDAAFLSQFPQGAPLSVLLKCDASPHIYALENDHKRWIKDIATFTNQGFVWSDVKIVDCAYLRRLPDGTPIPADAGTPPEP